MTFHIARIPKMTVLLCGMPIKNHFHFPADRVTQKVVDDRRTCPKCIDALLVSRTSGTELCTQAPVEEELPWSTG